jgi:hypothetical protein
MRKDIDTLQSKFLPGPSLVEYTLGDELDVMTSDGLARLVISTGRLLCRTSCDACPTCSEWYAVIEDKRWVRTEFVSSRGLPSVTSR